MLRGEDKSNIADNNTDLNNSNTNSNEEKKSYLNKFKYYYTDSSSSSTLPTKNTQGDYFDKLKTFYKLKKDKVNHKIENMHKLYERRLDEKERIKLLKSISKCSVFSTFGLFNFYYLYSRRIFKFRIFALSSVVALSVNVCLQYQLNQHYKRRIKEIGEEINKN